MTSTSAPSAELVADCTRMGEPIRSLGGGFMLDAATIRRGDEIGLGFASFYGLGRGGVLGDVDADVVAAAFVFFEPGVVRAIWETGRATMSPVAAAEAFADCCREWGRLHLAGAEGLDELCRLAERVLAAAPVAGLPLFAAWRAVALPDDLPARATQLCHVLREHRGGCHGVAVLASGLSPLEALIVNGGADTAALYGWPQPYPDPAALAVAVGAAEALTDRLAAPAYAVLSAAERETLAGLLDAAAQAAGGDAPDRIETARQATGAPPA